MVKGRMRRGRSGRFYTDGFLCLCGQLDCSTIISMLLRCELFAECRYTIVPCLYREIYAIAITEAVRS
jgi:hypothetical protein